MPGTNPKRTWVELNANTGVFTVIRLSTWAKYVEIAEDPAYNAGVGQGLQGNYLDPFAPDGDVTKNMEPAGAGGAVFAMNAAIPGGLEPPLTFGSKHALSNFMGAALGNPGSDGNLNSPGGRVTQGTPLVQLRSNSANATGIIISEYVA